MLAATLVIAPSLLATTEQTDGQAARATALDQQLAAAVARGDVPGLVVMAAARDRVLYQGVFGKADVAGGRDMTADAIFRIASMTKAVTTVAAMQLFEQGSFALDDPAEKYLPELANPMVFESFDSATGGYTLRPAASKITIRQLLTHTAGLGYGFTSATLRDFKPREGEKYAAGPLLFDPGTDWMYGTASREASTSSPPYDSRSMDRLAEGAVGFATVLAAISVGYALAG